MTGQDTLSILTEDYAVECASCGFVGEHRQTMSAALEDAENHKAEKGHVDFFFCPRGRFKL